MFRILNVSVLCALSRGKQERLQPKFEEVRRHGVELSFSDAHNMLKVNAKTLAANIILIVVLAEIFFLPELLITKKRSMVRRVSARLDKAAKSSNENPIKSQSHSPAGVEELAILRYGGIERSAKRS